MFLLFHVDRTTLRIDQRRFAKGNHVIGFMALNDRGNGRVLRDQGQFVGVLVRFIHHGHIGTTEEKNASTRFLNECRVSQMRLNRSSRRGKEV